MLSNSKKTSFMQGIFTIFIAQLVIKVLGLFYRVIITNIKEFGDIGNSYYSSGFRIYMLLLAVSVTGIPSALSKIISEKIAVGDWKSAHRIFRISLIFFTLFGTLIAGIMFLSSDYIAINLLKNPGVSFTLKILSPSIIFVAIVSVLRGYFAGMYDMKPHSRSQVIEQFFKSVLTVCFVLMFINSKPEIMAGAATLGTTIPAGISAMYLWIIYKSRQKDIWKSVRNSKIIINESATQIIKKIIKLVVPMSLGSIIVSVASAIDLVTVMSGLKKLVGSEVEANRLFGILMGKVDMLIGFPLSLNVAFAIALVPAVAGALATRDTETATKRISLSLRFSVLFGLPCSVGMAVLASPLLNLLFPNNPAGAEILAISSFTIIFSVLTQTINASLQGLGKLYIPAISLLIGAIIKVILNVTLVPYFGIQMAAISSVIYQLVTCLIGYSVLRSSIKLNVNFKNIILKPIIATGIMALITYVTYNGIKTLVSSNYITTFVSLMVASISYIIILFLIKAFEKSEISMLPFGSKIEKILNKIKV